MKILQTITAPQISVNDEFITIVGINFSDGDFIVKGSAVLEYETSKTSLQIESVADGYVYYYCSVGDEVQINHKIVEIVDSKIEKEVKPDKLLTQVVIPTLVSSPVIENEVKYDPVFSRSALILIEQHKLNKSLFSDCDFVNDEVVKKSINQEAISDKIEPSDIEKSFPKVNLVDNIENVTFERISPSKKREIEYLSSVQQAGLISTINIVIDTQSVFESINPKLKYFKDSILPLLIFEVSLLLKKYSKLNSFFYKNKLVKYNYVNVGMAIDIDDGLKVVNISNSDKKTILEIEDEMMLLSNKYLDKKLAASDIDGVTFTVTDLSAFKIHSFIPLINKNNAAILGITKHYPDLNKSMLSLSFDHRVTEGKYVSMFLTELKDRIESYSFQKTINDTSDFTCYKCFKRLDEDLNNVGFLKVINKKGEEKLICDNCFFRF